MGITFVRFVLTYNKQGANLDYVRDYNMLGDGQYINIGAKAPRPAAAKAFIDFFLDEESMKIQAETGEFVNRKGVYPPLADADKIFYSAAAGIGNPVVYVGSKTGREKRDCTAGRRAVCCCAAGAPAPAVGPRASRSIHL